MWERIPGEALMISFLLPQGSVSIILSPFCAFNVSISCKSKNWEKFRHLQLCRIFFFLHSKITLYALFLWSKISFSCPVTFYKKKKKAFCRMLGFFLKKIDRQSISPNLFEYNNNVHVFYCCASDKAEKEAMIRKIFLSLLRGFMGN